MIKVKNLILGDGIPKAAVPMSPADVRDAETLAEAMISCGADLIEFRADTCAGEPDIDEIIERLRAVYAAAGDIPILFTFRTSAEGGSRDYSSDEYETLCLSAAKSGYADLIDVEYQHERAESLLTEIHKIGLPVVLSNHDFFATPDEGELLRRLREMEKMGGDIAKIACMPVKEGDPELVLAASAAAKQILNIPYLVISMGKDGGISRLSAEVYGSCFTFGCLPDKESAPGQFFVDELHEELAAIHALRSTSKRFIFLTGFMGTGKSTVAAKLSEKVGLPVIEMDARIETEQNKSIPDIFAESGEEAFRNIETAMTAGFYKEDSAIVSCGGGLVLRKKNVDLMKALGTIVLLTAEPETLLARLTGESENRPNIRNRMSVEGISELLEKRRPFYEAAAQITVATDGRTIDEIAAEIEKML